MARGRAETFPQQFLLSTEPRFRLQPPLTHLHGTRHVPCPVPQTFHFGLLIVYLALYFRSRGTQTEGVELQGESFAHFRYQNLVLKRKIRVIFQLDLAQVDACGRVR